MKTALRICAVLAALAAGGCGLTPPDEQDRLARHYIEDLRTGNFADLTASFDPALRAQVDPAAFVKARALFPKGPVTRMTRIGSHILKTAQYTQYVMNYELELSGHWMAAQAVTRTYGNKTVLAGIHVRPEPDSAEHLNAFRLAGKSPMQLGFLAAAALMALFTIATAVVALRTPIPKRKWLWVLCALVGVCQLTLNWTTGHVTFAPLTIVLFGAGYWQQPYGPALIQLGIPVGAIWFWINRRRWAGATPPAP